MPETNTSSLDLFLRGEDPPTTVAESTQENPELQPATPPRESPEERMAALARARERYPSVLVDQLLMGNILPWEMEELWEGLDPDDEAAVKKFLSRKRLAEIIQDGLRAVRIAITRHGPDVVPDTAARASWMKLAMRFAQVRPSRPSKSKEPEAASAGPSEADFFEGLRGKPGIRRKIIERLQAMDREEGC